MTHISTTSIIHSVFFTVEELAEGVYAVLSKEGTGSWSNAGIINLGEETIVFDTFNTIQAAKDLRKAAESLTGRSPAYVINSHPHVDHYHGNQVFRDALIISTPETREQMAKRYPRFANMVKTHQEAHLSELAEQLKHETNPGKRRETESLIGEFTALGKTIEEAQLTLPTLTFESHLILHGSARSVEVITYGGGHSASDAFLYLPEERIAFLADLMHIGYHGEFSTGNPDEWSRILGKIEQLDIQTVVSGHGTIGTKDDIYTMLTYLADLKEFATRWINDGKGLDSFQEAVIPEKYQTLGAPSVFHRNLRYLLQNRVG